MPSAWTTSSATTSTTSTTVTVTWAAWNAAYTCGTTASTATTWSHWNVAWTDCTGTTGTAHYLPASGSAIWPATPEQRAQQVQREADWAAQRLQEQREREEAARRAEQLLTRQLDRRQRRQWRDQDAFEVVAPSGRRYRIRRGRSANVRLLDNEGREVRRYCAHPIEHVPDADTCLAQLLMLKTCEPEFLAMANAS